MELFLVRRNDDGGYDTFDSFVVAAKTKNEARLTHPYGEELTWNGNGWMSSSSGREDDSWAPPDSLTVEHIGTAKEDVSGVICASFHAG